MNCQAESDVRRVLRVMKDGRIREIGAFVGAEVKSDDIIASESEIELRKYVIRPRTFDVAEAITGELIPRINHDEIVRLKSTAHIVDADGDKSMRFRQFVQRLATATHDDRGTNVYVMKVGQRIHGVTGRLLAQVMSF